LAPSDKENQQLRGTLSAKESTRVEYGKTLAKLGEQYPDIVALDADLSGSTQTHHFAKAFPDRFFNLGIAEQDLMGTAAGLALGGKIPFASTFAMFATGRAWEQIRQTIAYGNVNVKIVASHGGVTVGEDGGSHQALEDLALMRILPNMVVLVPADGPETRAMVRWAADWRGPVYIRTGRMPVPVLYGDDYRFAPGRGSILREGDDVTLVGLGVMVHECLNAAEQLARGGLSARVVNLSCLKPLDWELLVDSARRTGAVVTAEEHMVTGGLGSAVSEVLGEHCPVPLTRLGVRDTFGISGKPELLLKHYGLTVDDLVAAAIQVWRRKTANGRELGPGFPSAAALREKSK
jgi:transketolase